MDDTANSSLTQPINPNTISKPEPVETLAARRTRLDAEMAALAAEQAAADAAPHDGRPRNLAEELAIMHDHYPHTADLLTRAADFLAKFAPPPSA